MYIKFVIAGGRDHVHYKFVANTFWTITSLLDDVICKSIIGGLRGVPVKTANFIFRIFYLLPTRRINSKMRQLHRQSSRAQKKRPGCSLATNLSVVTRT